MTRSRLKITPILVLLNIIVILFITFFYLARGIKYYKLENKSIVKSNVTLLFEHLEKKRSFVDLTKGLIFDESNNTYRYKGNVKDNYLYYSGIMYRIVGIDNESNVVIVSDESVTLMYSGLEKGLEDSYVSKWLNKDKTVEHSGEFYDTLYNADKLLANSYTCEDVIDDLQKITCKQTSNKKKLSILSLYDYSISGGTEGYLNNGEVFFVSSLDKDSNTYFVSSEGKIGMNTLTTKVYGVRPVLSLNTSTKILSGKGTKDNPYIIEKHDIKTIKDTYVGDIVTFSENDYKVVSKTKDTVKLASLNYIMGEDSEPITKSFASSSNKYSKSSGTVGNYLNNTYYDSLKDKSLIVESKWYIGENTLSDLDYTSKYDENMTAKVGMLSLGELFIKDLNDTFTLTRGMESSNIINVINKSGNIFGDLVSSKHYVRPAFYVENSLSIESGNGTEEKPYVLGGTSNEE